MQNCICTCACRLILISWCQTKCVDARGMSWPCGQGIGLAIVLLPVRTLPPRDKGGALVVRPGMPFP